MSSEGAAVAGRRSLVDPLMSPLIFAFLFFGFVWVLLPQLLWCYVCIVYCMVVVALFIKRGESLFRDGLHSTWQVIRTWPNSFILI